MAVQHPVVSERIRDILEISALRNTPLALTCRVDRTWQTFRSRFLGLREGKLWIEYPQAPAGDERSAPTLATDQKVGIAFKQRHHKYVFTTGVAQVAACRLTPETTVRALRLTWPQRMRQLQRRVFHRVEVPQDRRVFVDLWEGGVEQEPPVALRDKLLLHGHLVDLSIGGFQLRLLGDADPRFRVGTPLGAALLNADGAKPIKLDCQFRHTNADEFSTTLGVQIVGLNETAAGRKTLERLGRVIRGFQRDTSNGAEPARVHVGC
ncbi:MAG: PilZ domain-containing protein [Planctomycetota bacterium]